MGGAVGVLRTASDPRIVRLVSLAGMVHTANFARRKFGELVPGKDLMWDKPECPLSQVFVDDMNEVHSVMPLASRVTVPWLLIHGTADSVVPFQESVEISEAAGSNATLVRLERADHLFTAQERDVARIVVAWLERD
jgi:pimeloyl-ACP methyl ester carboxylesterase